MHEDRLGCTKAEGKADWDARRHEDKRVQLPSSRRQKGPKAFCVGVAVAVVVDVFGKPHISRRLEPCFLA